MSISRREDRVLEFACAILGIKVNAVSVEPVDAPTQFVAVK